MTKRSSPPFRVDSALMEMLLGTMLWGFGFIGAHWALPGLGPIFLTGARFAIAVVVLAAFKPFKYRHNEFKALFIPGVLLYLTLMVQTWGLKYTTPTRCGFITVLYVLFIPLIERLFFRVRTSFTLMLWIMLAIIGTAFICGAIHFNGLIPQLSKDMMQAFNLGDWLTLICAICAAVHFVAVEKLLKKAESAFHFHWYQCVWVVILSLITGPIVEGVHEFHFPWSPYVWAGVIELGIFSSAIAFLCQIRAQQTIKPATIGILSLLESPWAMFFSIVLGYEVMTHTQLVGAALIMIAAAGATLFTGTKKSS